jgi:hypothetical protein
MIYGIIGERRGRLCLEAVMELVDQLKAGGRLDFSQEMTDQPKMVLRGTAIGLQKTEYLPGRSVYEYPYTPENFPWFYDKTLWIDYLDMLVENRMNSLYLWNGHPFASLVKLEDYPYALEVDEETYRKNEDILICMRWIHWSECKGAKLLFGQRSVNSYVETAHFVQERSILTYSDGIY